MKIADKDGKLVITDFSEEEAYEIACNIEKEGIRFYKKLKDEQTNDKIIETLEVMVKEEVNHLKFFEFARSELQEALDEEIEDNGLLMSMDFGIFPSLENIGSAGEDIKGKGSNRALKLGIAVENKAIAFYTECKKKIGSESTKKGLDRIITEEVKHKTLFEEMLQRIS